MTITFFDLQDEGNPQNGARFASSDDLWRLIDTLLSERGSSAFQLKHHPENELVMGINHTLGFAQYTSHDSLPPYLMATLPNAQPNDVDMEFDIGGTMTPIAGKYLLPIDLVRRVVDDFVISGGQSSAVTWEEFE